ncbi:MAG: Mrp/NBP35 family ATP-binding protein [Chlamydiota bacterium]
MQHCHKIAIAAGKGGVGKSTITVNLALALASQGACVGILDADLYGPSIGKMLPENRKLVLEDEFLIPAEGHGIYYVSLAHFSLGKKAVIVRAPIANQIICDFLNQVRWPCLDFLLIDFPPGTGDIQLTLMQKTSLSGAILVTTPQEIALLDVEKAYQMFQQMQVPILGVVENMSYLEASPRIYPYGSGGGKKISLQHELKFFGELPLDPHISACCDNSESLFEKFPSSTSTVFFNQLAKDVQLSLMEHQEADRGSKKAFEVVWEN